LKAELADTRSDAEKHPTVADLIRVYTVEYLPRLRGGESRRSALRRIERNLGRHRLADLERRHISSWLAGLQKLEIKTATINYAMAALSGLLRWAVETGRLERSPMDGVKRLSQVEEPLRVMTPEECERFLSEVTRLDATFGAAARLMAETGMRLSEVTGLEWSAVDLQARRLTVGRSKSGKVRHLPLTPRAIEALRSVRRIVGVARVFSNSRRHEYKDTWALLDAARKAAGLPWVGWHGLRHYRATQWVRHGVDIRTVQGLLGHASIQMTMRYAHYHAGHAADEVARVAMLEAGRFQESDAMAVGEVVKNQ